MNLFIITGSEDERKDLKHAYLIGKGDMDYIADHVQFARSEHEPRYREIINVSIYCEALKQYTLRIALTNYYLRVSFWDFPEKKKKGF